MSWEILPPSGNMSTYSINSINTEMHYYYHELHRTHYMQNHFRIIYLNLNLKLKTTVDKTSEILCFQFIILLYAM